MPRLGAVSLPQLPPERLGSVARAADAAGLEQLWLWEDCFLQSGIASAASALAWTGRITVGVGLLPAPLRNAALAAMEIATLHRMFPGRVQVALGHGVQDWMAQAGARADSPVTLLREHVVAVRALLRGEEVSAAGRYVALDRVALGWPPQGPAPVLVGATGPRSLRLSGEVADGTLLPAGTTPDLLRRARSLVDEGRATGGRDDEHRFVVYLLAAAGRDAGERLARAQRASGHDPTSGVAGDAAAVAEAVHAWAAAGADSVVLQPTVDEPDPEGFLHFVGAEVLPLLR